MASPAQFAANRANAQKSTGPTTEEGKRRTSQNALLHGFTASQTSIDPLEQELFDKLANAYTERYKPQDQAELALVEEIITCSWSIGRIARLEAEQLRRRHIVWEEDFKGIDPFRRVFALSGHLGKLQRARDRAIKRLQEWRREAPQTENDEIEILWKPEEQIIAQELAETVQQIAEEKDLIEHAVETTKELKKLHERAVYAYEYTAKLEDEAQKIVDSGDPNQFTMWTVKQHFLKHTYRNAAELMEQFLALKEKKIEKTNPIAFLDHTSSQLSDKIDALLSSVLATPPKSDQEIYLRDP